MHILFLAHRAPFPPDRGDKIRSFHVLRYLAQRASVHLIAFAEDAREMGPPPALAELLASATLVPRTRPRWRAALDALATRRPVSLTAFDDARLHAAIAATRRAHPVDLAYGFSGQMAQYLPADVPAIMDFVDVDSAKFAAYARTAGAPLRWLYAREARLLGAYERAIAARARASLFVSEPEARLMPGGAVLENGIDAAFFGPDAPFAPVAAPAPLIVFTGQMDYPPNVEAVILFVRDMLPRLRGAHSDLRFAIVGRAPTAAVRALASPEVIVTGEVADVRGWLAAASVVVAPLALARGIQNKVLEAMAMARPVVASPEAAEGIDHAATIRVSANGLQAVEAIQALLRDPAGAARLGQAARVQVLARYDWTARLSVLDDLIGLPAAKVAA